MGAVLLSVPNKSLVTQTEADYINLGLDVGVYFGDRKEFGKTHTICTWQSLNNMLKKTKAGEAEVEIGDFLEDVVCIMVDEVHTAEADALKELLTGVMSNIPLLGSNWMSEEKFASQAIFISLGNVINKLSASELQDRGVLSQCHVNIVQLQDGVEFTNYQSELKHLLEDGKRLDKIAELITKIKDSGNTLILVDRVNAGKELVDRLPTQYS
jgi:superfamily II DNA or RNA helicase